MFVLDSIDRLVAAHVHFYLLVAIFSATIAGEMMLPAAVDVDGHLGPILSAE